LHKHRERLSNMTVNQTQEITALKAYSLGYCFKYPEAISAYEEAINKTEEAINKTEKTPAEWFFGLAFVKHKQEIGHKLDPDCGKEIESLYRKCLHIDPQYHFAKLRLARILWQLNEIQSIYEIEELLDEVIKNNPKNNVLLEDAASILRLTSKDIEKNREDVFKLYKQCEEINPKSANTLRGLALYYRDEKDYENSIKYFKLLIKESEKYFDKTLLADVYIENTKNGNAFEDDMNELYEDLKSQCKNERFRGKLYIWYSFSKYKYHKENYEKQIEYLEMVINHAHEAKENLYGRMKIIRKSQKRLIKLAENWVLQTKGQVPALELKSKVYGSQKRYLEAIKQLEKAEEISETTTLKLKFRETQVQYHFKNYVENLNLEDKLMEKIRGLPDSSNVKWKVLISKIIQDKHQKLGTLMEIWNSFEKKDRKPGDDIVAEKMAHNLIDESKRTLEGSMSYIKKEVFPDSEKQCGYPSPHAFKKKIKIEKKITIEKMNTIEKKVKIEKLFKKEYGWKEFSTKLPTLIDKKRRNFSKRNIL